MDSEVTDSGRPADAPVASVGGPAPFAPAPFAPVDGGWWQRTRRSFARQGFMRHVGARIAAVGPGCVEVTVDFAPHLAQQHGAFHGGLIASLADVASGYAAYSLLGDGVSNVTVELKLNLLRPAGGARLVARGEVVKPGRTLTVCRSDVFAVSDRQEVLCATSLGTFMTLRDRPERPARAPADDRP